MYGYKPTGTLNRVAAGNYQLLLPNGTEFGRVVRNYYTHSVWDYYTNIWPYVSGNSKTKREATERLQAILIEREAKGWIPS